MKIECLTEGSQDCPLIRIYGSNYNEFKQLVSAINVLISNGEDIFVHNLPGFKPINNCELIFSLGKVDKDIIKYTKFPVFKWVLTSDSWETVIELIEPFCEEIDYKCHQWVAGSESYCFPGSPLALLITNREDGRW